MNIKIRAFHSSVTVYIYLYTSKSKIGRWILEIFCDLCNKSGYGMINFTVEHVFAMEFLKRAEEAGDYFAILEIHF